MMRLLRLIFAFVIIAVVLSMNIRASHAYQTGDSKWCAVTNKGADTMQWECEYDSDIARRLLQALAATVQSIRFGRPDQSFDGH